MEDTKELKIEIPVGYMIDKAKSTFEKIVFKKKSDKPYSWEEYVEDGHIPKDVWWISDNCTIRNVTGLCHTVNGAKNLINSKEEAEAFLALMQLRQLRKAWIGDWERPEYGEAWYWYIVPTDGPALIMANDVQCSPLTFPTKEMAEEFKDTFLGLINQAKILM